MKPLVVLLAALAFVPYSALCAEFKIGDHRFTLPDGFTVEKVAGPGLIDRPIVGDFDEHGRLYVAESSGSNDPVEKQLKEKPHRIVRLEDTDANGVFDKSIVYADKMMFPEGAMWLKGSLYVSAPPVIWKLTDTNDDGVADRREEWLDAKTLTGCANDLHGPYLGLDGWIYWCKGAFAKQTYERPGSTAFETRAAHIFRRRPEGGLVEAVMTGGMDNPVDVAFTPEGERIFTTTFFQHPGGGQRDGLVHAIYGGVYGKTHDVLDDHKKTGDLMPVLTHLGPAAPAGLTRYESESFGADYRDNLFAALFNLHKITRHILQRSGATYKTVDSDFLVSDSTDFHPTDVIEDADGSLLVIDTGGWYKLCCPTSQLWKPDVLGAIYRIRRNDAAKVLDPRGEKIDFANASVEKLTKLLDDPRPAVARRAIQQIRGMEASARALEALFRGEAPERQQRNAVWALSGNVDPGAAHALAVALNSTSPVSVRHAAVHAMSANIDKADLTSLAKILTEAGNPPSLRRAAAEAIGRLKEARGVSWLLRAAAELKATEATGLPDRIQEHSIIYALIEINAPRTIRGELVAAEKGGYANAPMRRAAQIALDQIGTDDLQAVDIIPFLAFSDPVLKQTANWIVSHRADWGKELARYFEHRLSHDELSDEDWREATEQLSKLARSEPIREMVAKTVTEPATKKRLRSAMLQVMARSGLKETPESWAKSVTTLLKESPEAEVISTAAALKFKETPPELKTALESVASNPEISAAARLEALAALGETRLDAGTFQFVRSQLAHATVANRRLATSILAKAALDDSQLSALCDEIRDAGPLELARLLGAFEKNSNVEIGERLLVAVKNARALSSLVPDQIQRTFAKYAPVKDRATELAQSLNADHGQQSARIEELLPKLKGGDIRRGQAIFNSQNAACSACHAIGYLGGDLGPDLTRIGQVRTERDLLEAILYPSASFVRSYEPVVVETKDGEQFSGVLKKDAPDELVLGTGPGAVVRVARSEITETRPGKMSVMPQGLDEQLSEAQLADLLAFLKATRW